PPASARALDAIIRSAPDRGARPRPRRRPRHRPVAADRSARVTRPLADRALTHGHEVDLATAFAEVAECEGGKPESTMSARGLLESLAGVTSVIVGDEGGHLDDATGNSADAENVASAAAVLLRALEPLGDAVGLGSCNLLTIKSPATARVVARQHGAI